MTRELQMAIDKWYSDYCKINGKAPSWGELIEKSKEIEKKIKK